jgi:hypothetical protein
MPFAYTYSVAQGATLEVPLAIVVDGSPADLTHHRFKSTLKTAYEIPDSDPTVIARHHGHSIARGIHAWSAKGWYRCCARPMVQDVFQEAPLFGISHL